ncbi:hypothetical protein [Pseudoclavibacter helvolus]|uniref:Uncharacterized protein n=1 Tax=Pseudoclavibacter helvolus TaxID=255205 RepID=A0A7W4YFA3_9MICO|nr:hypothetical protein [Pseudoclavibacter helvolus]MBB2956806.1 hypothetical protein [Pseudoclavibacter helvolus]
MPEPERVKYARQVVAAQMLADLTASAQQVGAVLWEDYPELPEGEFAAVVELALQVTPPPAVQYLAARDFLASLADTVGGSPRARGGWVAVEIPTVEAVS